MSLIEEYDAMFEELGDVAAAFWKFFDMFRVELEENEMSVVFGKSEPWKKGTEEQLKELRSYWREQRKWVKKSGKAVDPVECRRRMWFWLSKVIEWSMFDGSIRRDIYYWFDTCEERIMIAKQNLKV
jgi:hypothetical protein